MEPNDPTAPSYYRYTLKLSQSVSLSKSELISALHKFQRNSKDAHICMLIRRFFEWVVDEEAKYVALGGDVKVLRAKMSGIITHLVNRYVITLFEEGCVLHFSREEQEKMVTSLLATSTARDAFDWQRVAKELCSIQEICIGYPRGRMGSIANAVAKILCGHNEQLACSEEHHPAVRDFESNMAMLEDKGMRKPSLSKMFTEILRVVLEGKGFGHLTPLLETAYMKNTEVRRTLGMTVLAAAHLKGERPVKQAQPSQYLDDEALIASVPDLAERLMVRDEHVTGKGKDGRLTKFKQQGCKVSPQTSLSLWGLGYQDLEDLYIREKELSEEAKALATAPDAAPGVQQGNATITDNNTAKNTKKRAGSVLVAANKKPKTDPNWAAMVVKNMESKIRLNKSNRFVAMASPQVKGVRVSDAKNLTDSQIQELLLVLVYRAMIATKDTNLFNLMVLADGRILSVDENPMPGSSKLYVGDPSDLGTWLQTAQKLNKKIMDRVEKAAATNPVKIAEFLERFRDAYFQYKSVLQETYSQQEITLIDQKHRCVYAQFGVDFDPKSFHDHQAGFSYEWDQQVAGILPANGIMHQDQLNLAESTCCGFKNASIKGTFSGPSDCVDPLTAFIKIGEPAESARFSRYSAMLRSDLRLASVPVTPVVVRVTDPAAFAPAARRGQAEHYNKKGSL